jgi:CRP-like cAMP-binding protein
MAGMTGPLPPLPGDVPPFDRFAALLVAAAAPLVPQAAVMAGLRAASDIRVVPRRGYLLRLGDVADHVFFVLQGLLRFCSVDPATGEERTGQFFDEGRLFTETGSYFGRTPANQAVQAVVAAQVLRLPRTALLAAFDADHAVERFGRLMIEEALAGSQRRSANLLTLAPDERYRRFVETRPEVARRVPQYLIASYLGITPEALSRIRARIARTARQGRQ